MHRSERAENRTSSESEGNTPSASAVHNPNQALAGTSSSRKRKLTEDGNSLVSMRFPLKKRKLVLESGNTATVAVTSSAINENTNVNGGSSSGAVSESSSRNNTNSGSGSHSAASPNTPRIDQL